MISCCFFGHREIYEDINDRLEKVLTDLVMNKGVSRFFVGDSGMYDGIVRRKLEALKEKHNQISCSVILAYMPQHESLYGGLETIFPDGIESVPKRYAIVYRNKWMIEKCDYVVTYVKNDIGGAAKFKGIAERKGKQVINIAEM